MAEAKTRRRRSTSSIYKGALTHIVKMAGDGKSKQIKDPFVEMYGINGIAIEPLLSPDKLQIVMEENAIHSAAVQAKAADAVGRGWRLESKDPDNEDKSVEADLRENLEDLTPEWSFAELLRQAAEEEESIGWSVWEVVREGDYASDINALFPLPAPTIRVTRYKGVYVQIKNYVKRYFVEFGYDKGPLSASQGVDGNGDPIKPKDDDDQASEIIFFRTYSTRNPFYGMPRWLSALPALAELTAIREYNISWFASGGTTDRLLHVTGASDEEAAKVADDVRTQLEDSVGRGHVTLITHSAPGVEPKVVFLTQTVGARDGQFMKRRDDLHKEVLIAHQVPSYRVGLTEEGALGGTSAPEMLEAYKSGVVEPLQTIIEDRLAHTLFGKNGLNLGNWAFKLEELIYDRSMLDLQSATQAVQFAVITPNEARHRYLKMERFDAKEADMLYYQGQPIASDDEGINDAVGVIGQFTQAIQAAKEPQLGPDGKPLPPGTKAPPGKAVGGGSVPGSAMAKPTSAQPPKASAVKSIIEGIANIARGDTWTRVEKVADTIRSEGVDVVKIVEALAARPVTLVNEDLANQTLEKLDKVTVETRDAVTAAREATDAARTTTEATVVALGELAKVAQASEASRIALESAAEGMHQSVDATKEQAAAVRKLADDVKESVTDLAKDLTSDPGELSYDMKGRVTGFKKVGR